MGDLFQRVFNGVREGVHRVDAPLVARVVVGGTADAVDGRVPQVDVGLAMSILARSTIEPSGLPSRISRKRAGFRLPCGCGTGCPLPGGRKVTPVGAHFFGRLFVHVGQAGADQGLGRAVHEVEVVAGVVQVAFGLTPLKFESQPKPSHVTASRMESTYCLFFPLGWCRQAHVAHATVVAPGQKLGQMLLACPTCR